MVTGWIGLYSGSLYKSCNIYPNMDKQKLPHKPWLDGINFNYERTLGNQETKDENES